MPLAAAADVRSIGDVPVRRCTLLRFYPGARHPHEPFFMARDRTRPYTYSAGMSDFKSLLGRVSEDTNFGHHGLRVEGYNLSVDGNGEDVTVAHGLWKSTAHTRYARFSMRQVCSIPAVCVQLYGTVSTILTHSDDMSRNSRTYRRLRSGL